MNAIVMDGVEEYAEGLPVSLDIEGGEIVISAINAGGYNGVKISLRGLLSWLSENTKATIQIDAILLTLGEQLKKN